LKAQSIRSGHGVKTDNYNIADKVRLRRQAISGIESPCVLDLFAGKNTLWSKMAKNRYYGVELENGKGENLNVNNLRVIPSLDLSKFNVIDLDSYGIPANQIVAIFSNPTLKDGTAIVYTCITSKISGLNRDVIDILGLRGMYKKVKTLFNGKGKELFYALLYKFGVREVFEYSIKQKSFHKTYGYFYIKK
jgi:hypothetical protein